MTEQDGDEVVSMVASSVPLGRAQRSVCLWPPPEYQDAVDGRQPRPQPPC